MTVHSITFNQPLFKLDGKYVTDAVLFDALTVRPQRGNTTRMRIRYLWSEDIEEEESISGLIDVAGDEATLFRYNNLDVKEWISILYDKDNHAETEKLTKWIANKPSMYLYVKLIGKSATL